MPRYGSQRSTQTTYRPRRANVGQRRIKKKTLAKPLAVRRIITKNRRRPNRGVHYQNVRVQGIGGQTTYYKASRPVANPMLWKSVSAQYMYTNQTRRITATAGVQSVFQLSCFDAYNSTASDKDLQNIVATVQSQYGTSPSNKTSRVLVQSATAKVMFTNQDLGNCHVTIYDVVCKRDSQFTPLDTWFQGGKDESDSGTLDISTLVGNTPQTSRYFRDFYKVVQKSRIVLGAGQSHEHYIRLTPNRMFDGEMLNTTLGSTANNFRGLTFWTLIAVHGFPYNDVTTTTQVSTGSCALDVVHTKQLSFKFLLNDTTKYTGTSTLPTGFTVGERVMQVGGASAQSDQQA